MDVAGPAPSIRAAGCDRYRTDAGYSRL